MSQSYKFVIVGSGVMGTSIAYHLSRSFESICVIDEPWPGAASRDVNKIVRCDYAEEFYMRLMADGGVSEWGNTLFSGLVHKSGRVVRYGESQLQSITNNRQRLGLPDLKELSPQDAAQKFKDLIHCPAKDGSRVVFNAEDLWVELPGCVQRMTRAAQENGVEFQSHKAADLVFDQTNGQCIGVRTAEGTIVHAGKVIVAAGAWTQELLDKTLGDARSDLRDLPLATGVCVAHFKIDSEEAERFVGLPIFSDIEGEILPLTPDGTLKITSVKSFTSRGPEKGMSVPKDSSESIPEALKKEVRRFVENVCPTLSGKGCNFKIYWDGITESQDPILDFHPRYKNVIITAGGSFHMAKFLPIWGKYVVDLINGNLAKEYASRWSLARISDTDRHKTQPRLEPQRDLSDFTLGK